MALTRDTLAERKLKIALRGQFRMKQQFEYEDWKEQHLYPILEAVKSGKAVPQLQLPEGVAFDIRIETEK